MRTDWTGVSLVIAAIGVALTAVIGSLATAYVQIMGLLRSNAKELRKNTIATYTSNGTPLGALGEAAESRRISRIPAENRTESEAEHLAVVPLPERPGRDGTGERRSRPLRPRRSQA